MGYLELLPRLFPELKPETKRFFDLIGRTAPYSYEVSVKQSGERLNVSRMNFFYNQSIITTADSLIRLLNGLGYSTQAVFRMGSYLDVNQLSSVIIGVDQRAADVRFKIYFSTHDPASLQGLARLEPRMANLPVSYGILLYSFVKDRPVAPVATAMFKDVNVAAELVEPAFQKAVLASAQFGMGFKTNPFYYFNNWRSTAPLEALNLKLPAAKQFGLPFYMLGAFKSDLLTGNPAELNLYYRS